MDLFSLNGKKALVTGGASGLGLSMVEGLHEAGAAVGIIDVSRETDAVAVELSRSGPPAVGVRAKHRLSHPPPPLPTPFSKPLASASTNCR